MFQEQEQQQQQDKDIKVSKEDAIEGEKEEDADEASAINGSQTVASTAAPAPATTTTTTSDNNSMVALSNIVGEFGCFQLLITLLAFIRYICLAMMTNSGALIAPDQDFRCQIPDSMAKSIIRPANDTSKSLDEFLINKCQLNFWNNNNETSVYKCSSFTFLESIDGIALTKDTVGITLTNSYNLICDRRALRSTFQSVVYMGVLLSVIWGSISDRYGRNLTWRICFVWSLVFGLVSFLAEDFLTFTIARSLCTFGDAGLVLSLLLIVIEILGNKYRGIVCVIIYTGWSIGVMIMPWLIEYFKNFKHLMLFTVMCHLFTLPWMFWTIGESVRWLLVEGYFREAKLELDRINVWNGNANSNSNDNVEEKFNLMKRKYILLSEKRKDKRISKEAKWSKSKYIFMIIFGGLSKIRHLFLSKELTIVTLSTALITFNGELFYMITTQFNSDIGDSIKLNYLIGGFMEILASIVAILMISSLSRKLSLTITLVTISGSFFMLASTHQLQTVAIWVLNFAKFAISTLTSLIYVVITELYPTNLRQTGIGLTGLLGGSGAIIGPYIRKELVDLIGLTNVLYLLSMIPLISSITVIYLRETRDVELSDDVDELEEFTNDNNNVIGDNNEQVHL